MTYLQMICFISLAETQKMSITASALGLSLSTLSKYIDRLEDEFSVTLFIRKGSRKVLTREGELIYPSIKYMAKQYDDMRRELRTHTSPYDSHISIGIGYQQSHVMRQLTAFIKAHPKVEVAVTECSSNEICSMLNSGRADIGIVYEQIISKKYPRAHPISQDKLCAVVSTDHPLAQCKTISTNALQGEKFLLYKGDSLMYRYLLNVCIAAGFVPDVEYSTLRLSTLLINVAAGNGVTLLTEKTVDIQNISGVVALNLSENPLLTTCAVSLAEYPDQLHDTLIQYLLDGC
ncbi:MAG: LysR family transcriptional regulator [Oscillospiraceae bacterium]|nr:LysR family transcriptional regulator [Oscillospiraceae bacterium]